MAEEPDGAPQAALERVRKCSSRLEYVRGAHQQRLQASRLGEPLTECGLNPGEPAVNIASEHQIGLKADLAILILERRACIRVRSRSTQAPQLTRAPFRAKFLTAGPTAATAAPLDRLSRTSTPNNVTVRTRKSAAIFIVNGRWLIQSRNERERKPLALLDPRSRRVGFQCGPGVTPIPSSCRNGTADSLVWQAGVDPLRRTLPGKAGVGSSAHRRMGRRRGEANTWRAVPWVVNPCHRCSDQAWWLSLHA